MSVLVKKLVPEAQLPKFANPHAGGADLVATSRREDNFGNVIYGTGIAIELPKGYSAFIYPRSSNSKKDLILCNSVGLIDNDYRGELMVVFKKVKRHVAGVVSENDFEMYEVGDRIAQLAIKKLEHFDFVETENLTETVRGEGGFGSTGK